jgi:hypothetical protein
MSALLEKLDRVFGTVCDRQACVLLLVRRYGAVAQDLPVALVVFPEQARGKVVAAAVPLAEAGVDLDLHQVTLATRLMIMIKERSIL